MINIAILFFLSGFAALSYEVLWQRELGLIFGNTIHAAATVTAAYMAGIAVGAYFAGKKAEKLKNPIKTFGLLELGIGLYALAVPLLFALLKIIYKVAYQNISESLSFLTVLRVVLGLLVLLVPTILMGATLPVLGKALAEQKEKFGAKLSVLYGMNTLGAVAGVLSCAYFMIPNLGMVATRFCAVGVSVLVALVAVGIARKENSRERTQGTQRKTDSLEKGKGNYEIDEKRETALRKSINHEVHEDHGENKREKLSRDVKLLLVAAGCSGFLGLSFEVVWFRTLILVFGSTTYSFSTMLAIFLLGISVGAMALGWISDKMKHPALLFGMAATGIGIYSLISLYWFDSMPEWLLQHLATHGMSWGNMISAKFLMAFKFLFVPAVLFGVSFTAATKAVRALLPSSSRTIGDVSAFNTVGAAIGAIAAGFVILPLLGMEKSIMLLSFLAIALGALVLLSEKGLKLSRFLVIGSGAVCIIIVLLFTPKWEKTLLASGPYFSPWMYVQNGEIVLNKKLQSERLLFFKEGRTSTISTVKDINEVIFFSSNGKVEADTAKRSMTLQRMMSHLPMLFHPNPKQVMNIGLGAGVTFGSLGCYPVDHLEVVEIEPEVKNVALVWGDLNHRIVERDDAIITINDGRNHLFATARKYDVITSDPFEPVMAGAGNLYTVEHFEQAKKCLAKGGIMAQFLPMYELSKEDYLIIARTFTHVFPRSALFFTGYDTVLVGFTDDAPIDFRIAQKNYEIPAVKKSLSEIGFTSLEMILGMFIANLTPENKVVGTGTLNTDNHPVIEFSAPRSTLHYTPDINMQALLDIFSPIPSELASTLTADQLKKVTSEHAALKKTLQASIAKVKGDGQQVFQLLQEALALAPDNPVIKNEMVINLTSSADNLRMSGDPENAWMQYQIALQFGPDEFFPLYHLVGMAMQNKNPKAAKKFLDKGLAAYPESPMFIALRGKYRGTTGDLPGAVKDLKSALDELPRKVDLWQDYAFFLGASGDIDGAKMASDMAKELATAKF